MPHSESSKPECAAAAQRTDSISDPDRLRALAASHLLDTGPEPAFDRLTRLAAALLDAPVALISLVDERRQYFKSSVGLPEPWASLRETPHSHSFCRELVASGEPLIVGDARCDPRVSDNLAIRDLNVIAYAGMPLVDRHGQVLGSLCVIDHRVRRWTAGRLAGLADLAASVMTEIERRDLDRRLRTGLREAVAANAAKSQFLANMSHEIRTPMAALLGYAELLSDRLADPDDLQSVETIRRNGEHLLELVNDLLDMSCIEAGQQVVRLESVDLGELLGEVSAAMEPRAAESALAFRLKGATALPETIQTDPRRLRQILINLVGNAIKFTDRGSVEIRVSHVSTPEPTVRFDVIDTGVGVRQSELATLFEPFGQGRDSRTSGRGGVGLGLSLSRRLAEALGGHITVPRSNHEGSVFRLSVPSGSVDGVRIRPLDPVTPGRTRVPYRPRPLKGRVLVAEDHAELRALLQADLEAAGLVVHTAVDGQQALRAAADIDFDAILLDVQMPALDGLATTRALRARGYRRTIIALTAHAMKADRDRCLAVGCDHYLSKPVERRALLELLEQCLGEPVAATAVTVTQRVERILVVEDSDDVGSALDRLLRGGGFEPTIVTSGRAALDAIETLAPDATVIDLGLPDMDGLELCRRLRAEPRLKPGRVIALTGDPNRAAEAMSAGFDHYLVKPVRFATLKAALLGQPDATAGVPNIAGTRA